MSVGPVGEGEILELLDDEGEEHSFEVLQQLMIGDQQYLICIPEHGTDDEAYAFRLMHDEEETYLEELRDDEELAAVERMWQEMLDEEG